VNLTAGAIRRYPMVLAFMVVLVLVGVDSYLSLPRESSPDVKIPYVMVVTPYAGASPEDVEHLITRKLERQLKGLPDLKEMTSTSREGVSTVVLEFTPDVDMGDALQRVRDRVDLAKPDLPEKPREDLMLQELSSDQWPIIQVNLAADYDPALLEQVGEDLQDLLEQVPGVLKVDLSGGIRQEVRVDVDPQRLQHYQLSLQDVQDAVSLENITIPGGKLSLGMYDYQVSVPGEVSTPGRIADFVVNPGDPVPVTVGDVATVSFGPADPVTIARVNGLPAVILSVSKRSGENIIAITDRIKEIIAQQRPDLPPGTRVSIVGDRSREIRNMLRELENNIISGLILVVAVLLLFLGLTNALFVGAAIPLSMLISFIVLRLLGVTLNMVVLFSLILALGMLVDNAIVIVENIYRHRSEGQGSEQAARVGARQVAGAVTASTLTTVCAFFPLLFWPGIMGEFMKYLPLTVIVALSASLLVALVFNPVLCAQLMRLPRPRSGKPRLGDRWMGFGLRIYEPMLRWTLAHRARTLTGMTALLAVMLVLFGLFNRGVELFPDTDPTVAYVGIKAPSGTRIGVSDAYTRQVERAVAKTPDLKAYTGQVGATVGGGLSSTDEAPPNQAVVTMEFVDRDKRRQSSRKSVADLRRRLRDFTGAELTVDKVQEGPPTGPPVNIEISGDDFTVLGEIAAQVKKRIRGIAGLVDVTDDFDRTLPKVEVIPDIDKAGRYGLQTWDIASTVRTALNGTEVTKFRLGEDEYNIRVRYRPSDRDQVEDLRDLRVFYEGNLIPLSAFADVRFTSGIAAIHRIDARRVVTVSGQAADGFNGNALLREARRRLADLPLPGGYALKYTGENQDQQESSAFLSRAFLLALLLITLVLVSEFGSVTVPLVIMSSVVLSLIGVFAGLLITGTPFGIIMTGVGVISLAGVVVNNAIVLLDYTIQLRERGLAKTDAIVRAGMTRFRPVMLTAVTTILGLIPLTTGLSVDFVALLHGQWRDVLAVGGESSQWWGPMGVAVIWGLAVATFLTLVVVPVMYSSLDPLKRGLRRVLVDWWSGTGSDER